MRHYHYRYPGYLLRIALFGFGWLTHVDYLYLRRKFDLSTFTPSSVLLQNTLIQISFIPSYSHTIHFRNFRMQAILLISNFS